MNYASPEMNSICRCCLVEHLNLLNIFESGIRDKLSACAYITVAEDDQLPKVICEPCSQQVASCYAFLQTCIRSETVLRNLITPSRSKYVTKEKEEEEDGANSKETYRHLTDRGEIHTIVEDSNVAVCLIAELSNISSSDKKYSLGRVENNTVQLGKTESLDKIFESQDVCSVEDENSCLGEDGSVNLHSSACSKQISPKHHTNLHLDKQEKIGDVCDRKFRFPSDLKGHLKSHLVEQEAKYQCSECGRTFVRNTNLLYHMKIHSGERAHKCPSCPKAFITRSQLNTHVRTHTRVQPPPKAKCHHCGKNCLTNSELRVHLRTHTGERPFQCNICCRRFLLKVHLDVHMRSHTGEKPYPCSVCDRYFSSLSTRKKHMFLHTGEKKFRCDICGKCFAQAGILNTHKKRHETERAEIECLVEC